MERGAEPGPELGAVLEAVEGHGGGAEAVERVLAWYNEEVTGPIPLPSASICRRCRRPAPPAIGSPGSSVLDPPRAGLCSGSPALTALPPCPLPLTAPARRSLPPFPCAPRPQAVQGTAALPGRRAGAAAGEKQTSKGTQNPVRGSGPGTFGLEFCAPQWVVWVIGDRL